MKQYNIFLAIGGRATTIQNSKIWIRNLYDPLLEIGHNVTLFDTDEFLLRNNINPNSKKAKEILSYEILKKFKFNNERNHHEIFLSYLHSAQVDPNIFKEIKKDVFTINYTTNFHQFSLYKEIAQIVDLNIYVSRIARQGFEQIGAKSFYMPFAANPNFYKPSFKKNNNYVVFIGSPYGRRPYLMWRLLQNNLNVKIYGPGWNTFNYLKTFKSWLRKKMQIVQLLVKDAESSLVLQDILLRKEILAILKKYYSGNIYGPLNDENYRNTLADSHIVINMNESRYDHNFTNHNVLLGVNLRDFEVPMSGTMLLTQYSDELEDFYKDGEEVVSFRNEYELVDKLRYYYKNQDKVSKIALAGYKRAISEHTWRTRFEKFFQFIEKYL